MDNNILKTDEDFIREAMRLAGLAEEIDEVPVGAVAVRDGKIIASAFNTRESSKCATHHAEILAIEAYKHCLYLCRYRFYQVCLQ